jgi:hypothetical protein
MRLMMMMLLALMTATPLAAQDTGAGPAEGKEAEKEDAEKPKITEAGAKLLEDVNLVYDKYYAILLDKTKAGESYSSDEVWDTAVKEARHAKYKDRKEFHAAITAMQRTDRVFRKEMQAVSTAKAKAFAEAVEKWAEEKQE